MAVPPQGRSGILNALGESGMKALARSYVWWPAMGQEIVKKVCQAATNVSQIRMNSQKHHYTPGSSRDSLGQEFTVDYAEPYKGEMLLVVVDAYFKWLEVHRTKSFSSTATIIKLREMSATHGLPVTLVSDNGSNFTSSEFQEFMKKNGIKQSMQSKWHLIILHQMAWQRG